MTTIIGPTGGTPFDSADDKQRVLLGTDDTDGAYTIIEDNLQPGFNLGLHMHRSHAETFYVVDGSVEFTVGKQEVTATAGSVIHISPQTPHAARSDKGGKMIMIFQPAGFEGAMQAFASMTPEDAKNPAVIQAIKDKFDIVDLAMPPVPELINYYDVLLAGDSATVKGLFAAEPHINTPLQGCLRGAESVDKYVAEQKQWLSERQAKPEFYNVIVTEERIVVEVIVYLTQDGETFDLPVALVAEREGDKLSTLRVYHSTWPLDGSHIRRDPIVALPAEEPDEPAIITAYMRAIDEGNVPFVISLFAADGYLREPAGSRYKHQGNAGLHEFYDPAFGNGGVPLKHCTATFDGFNFAVEYICDQWGSATFAPQAGMAVYQLDGKDKIKAVRIYDDVTPPYE